MCANGAMRSCSARNRKICNNHKLSGTPTMAKTPTSITREQRILIMTKAPCGTYPGQNRSRKFVNRKKQENKRVCRGKWLGQMAG